MQPTGGHGHSAIFQLIKTQRAILRLKVHCNSALKRKAVLFILFPEFQNYYGENSDQLPETLLAGLRVGYQYEIGGIYYYPKGLTPL